ncbi:MAG: aldehyde ferredoxin oxidoreductase C-terminal domain-containing protein [Dehalococcoidales bacterium]|nr:aldehyde ferredoxin oxidoreductase C-terminal domain-containing protein [Dehalococcoidales bacterium]
MGDKMLKAIVVRGTKDLNIADPARVAELCGQLLDRSETIREEVFANFGRQNVQGYTRQAGYGNRSGAVFPELKEKIDGVGKMAQEFMEEKTDRRVACYNCPQHCHRAYARSDGGYMVIKCTSWGMGIVATKIFDMDFTLAFYDLVQKYGLDSMALSNQIAFAIDLYERGILTKEDTDGMHLEWGNAEVALSLVDKIAHREGIGDLLADGTYRAAQRIGRGAEYYAYHVKKYDQHPFRREGYLGLSEAINDKADTTKLLGTTPAAIWKRGKDFIDSWGFHYPEDYKRYVQTPPDPTGADYEGTIKYMTYNEEIFNLADLAGLCYFWTGHYEPLPVNSRAFYAELVSAVTGIDIDEAMATEMAKRVVNLVRGYNVRAGLRRKDDMLPDRYFTIPPAPGTYKADKVLFNKWVDEWYKVRGWDGDGIPARETLEGLGLDYVVRDLERRGILARPATALVT